MINDYLPIVIFALLMICIVWGVFIYNRLVRNKNRMQEAWSGMDVYLKKRCDLVPNLVEIVKGYAAHEQQVLEEITRCRTDAMQARNRESRIRSETGLEKALNRLAVVVENYPDLKANHNFADLQQQLVDVEEDLVLSRRYYNGTVRENNIYTESFPFNLIAGWFHFPKGDFFSITAAEKETPNVSLQ